MFVLVLGGRGVVVGVVRWVNGRRYSYFSARSRSRVNRGFVVVRLLRVRKKFLRRFNLKMCLLLGKSGCEIF